MQKNSWVSPTPWKNQNLRPAQPASTQLEPARHQLLEHQIGIIPPLHLPQPPHVRSAVVRHDILVIARIVHELVRQVAPAAPRHGLDLRVDRPRRAVRGGVAGREPVARVEHEPGLVEGLQAQGVAAAREARVHEAGGVGLQAQCHGAGGYGRDGLQLGGGGDDFGDLRVERGVGREARGEPVPSGEECC